MNGQLIVKCAIHQHDKCFKCTSHYRGIAQLKAHIAYSHQVHQDISTFFILDYLPSIDSMDPILLLLKYKIMACLCEVRFKAAWSDEQIQISGTQALTKI